MVTIVLLVSVVTLPIVMLAMLLPSAQRVADSFDKN
jgi:hypothetical protein